MFLLTLTSFTAKVEQDSLGDSCVESAWKKADELQRASNTNWSEWDFWDVTDTLYKSCIKESKENEESEEVLD